MSSKEDPRLERCKCCMNFNAASTSIFRFPICRRIKYICVFCVQIPWPDSPILCHQTISPKRHSEVDSSNHKYCWVSLKLEAKMQQETSKTIVWPLANHECNYPLETSHLKYSNNDVTSSGAIRHADHRCPYIYAWEFASCQCIKLCKGDNIHFQWMLAFLIVDKSSILL